MVVVTITSTWCMICCFETLAKATIYKGLNQKCNNFLKECKNHHICATLDTIYCVFDEMLL